MDMYLVSGSCLEGFADLTASLGGDSDALLTRVGINPDDAGSPATTIPLRSAIAAVESTATTLAIDDFGRRLALRQTIDILGPVGVGARTATTVAEAFAIFDAHMGAYSPGISTRIRPGPTEELRQFEYEFMLHPRPAQAQAMELALGLTLQVLRLFLGSAYRPVAVQLPHSARGSESAYRDYYRCPPQFNAAVAGFTLRAQDLRRPLRHDRMTHRVVLGLLTESSGSGLSTAAAVRSRISQQLSTGTLSADAIAGEFGIHPKTLQRRLSAERTSFADLVDQTRRELARRLLGETDLSVAQISRRLGYAEQSVLSRACKRWFAMTPTQYRCRDRSAQRELPGQPGTTGH